MKDEAGMEPMGRSTGWTVSATLVRATMVAALLAFAGATWTACREPGLSNGAGCTRATQCDSLTCSFALLQDASADGARVGTCVGRCSDTMECASGLVCGRYDFRGIVPDSGGPDAEGVREGPDFEVVRACRPRETVACASDGECGAGKGCIGAPMGVCAERCTRSSQCAAGLCIGQNNTEACGADGLCAQFCDHGRECPSGAYCQFSFSNSVHGRCVPIALPDAAVCPAPSDGGDASDGADGG